MKKIISALLAFAVFASANPAGSFDITASAAEKLTSSVSYKTDGTAVVELEASDFYNMVRYTTDGSVPTSKSPLYIEPIEITEKTLLRVAEFDDGEKVKGIKLNVTPKTGKVSFKVTQLGEGKALLVMDCATEDAELRYTTDGTKPNQSSELYEGPIVVEEKTKFRVRAYKDGYKTATTYAKTVKITDPEPEKASEAVSEPVKDTVSEPEKETEKETVKEEKVTEKVVDDQKISYKVTYMDDGRSYVTLTPAKNGYTIRYTTDGSTPTAKTGKKYTSRVKFTEPGVLRARQYNKAGQCVGTIKLNVKIKCADVEFTCVGMDSGVRTIKMECATPGATIYYTTNNTIPKVGTAKVYTEPFVIGELADIYAIAAKDGYKNSSLVYDTASAVTMKVDNFDFSDWKYTETAQLINNLRVASWGKPLTLDEKLTHAACLRAKEISVYLDHIRPNGRSYTTAISAEGLTCNFCTEIISAVGDTPAEFINYVLTNEDNKNKLIGNGYSYSKLGVGHYEVGGRSFWVILITD